MLSVDVAANATRAYGHSCRVTFLIAAIALLSVDRTSFSDQTNPDQTNADRSGWLVLTGGDHLAGSLEDSLDDEPGKLVWQHPQFAGPIQFDIGRLIGASFMPPEENPTKAQQVLAQLAGGDRLFGDLVSIDNDNLTLSTVDAGEVSIGRDAVASIWQPKQGVQPHFVGPSGIGNWTSEKDKSQWRDYLGRLSTDQAKASLFRADVLPKRARIDLNLSWRGKPNFVLAIGVDKGDIKATTKDAFRIEIWDGQLVLFRETGVLANLVSLGKVSDFGNSLKVRIDLDQTTGRLLAWPQTKSGKSAAADPKVLEPFPNAKVEYRSGIRLINLTGSVSLDAIQVTPLVAEIPGGQPIDQDVFLLDDETIVTGRWSGIENDTWLIDESKPDQDTEASNEPLRIESQRVLAVRLADASEDSNETDDKAAESDGDEFGLLTHSGMSVTGSWKGVKEGRLSLQVDGFSEPVSFATERICRIDRLSGSKTWPKAAEGRSGRLETTDARLMGTLVSTPSGDSENPIHFQPWGSGPVPLGNRFVGQLVYRDPPPPESPAVRRARLKAEKARQARERARRKQADFNVMNIFARAFTGDKPGLNLQKKAIHLRTGEIIPGDIKQIDETTIIFDSEVTSATKLPSDQIRAIRLTSVLTEPDVDEVQQERLLTVPRVNKKNPPTHLLIARNGDLLRCRLVRMSEDVVTVETRLETIEIERSLLSQIIWLDNLSEQSDPETESPEVTVRAKLANGNQLSMVPQQVTDKMIIGSHPHLGKTEVSLDETDVLIFGSFVSLADAGRPFQQWQLRDAPEPMIAGGGEEDGGRVPGMASVLVGKPAPDFKLEKLDGGDFRVSDQKGKVVVLDFWATWCGPCLQAMPVIEETVSEFDPEEVILVAVNLQEGADAIRKTLDRLNISPTVALDIDGVAAARYQADAIPQTVVIDREGTVARVFVGSGGKLGEQLTLAIEKQLVKGLNDAE